MRTLFLIIFLLLMGNTIVIAQQSVAASIRPLQLIAAAITDGVSEPLLVMDGSQDPHHPSLRPSQRRAIAQAQIFIWIGPELETGMERIAQDLDSNVLTVIDFPGLNLYQSSNAIDPHVWLDTTNAGAIALMLANTLIQIDSKNERQYSENLKSFQVSLKMIEQEVKSILAVESFPPFAVYHDGYQYFERQFGLSHIASFTSNEEVQPGIRKILEIKQVLEEKNVNCIVVDPAVNTVKLSSQLERDNMHFVSVDILAHDIPLASDSYFTFMETLAESFASCRR